VTVETGGGPSDDHWAQADARRAWRAIRGWEWWQQGLLWLVLPVPVWLWAWQLRDKRRWGIGVAVVASFAYAVAVAGGGSDDQSRQESAKQAQAGARPKKTTTSDARGTNTPTSTTQPATTSTRPAPTTTAVVSEAERDGDPANSGTLYPNRPGRSKDDHEARVGGEPVRFSGWSIWVERTAWVNCPSTYNCGGYLRAHVKLLNRDDSEQTWHEDDFSIQTPRGEIYSPTTVLGAKDQPLGFSKGLVHGGASEGDIWFHVGDLRGQYYILWEPIFDSAHTRGVWGVDRPQGPQSGT
jgi:hypothetical protein